MPTDNLRSFNKPDYSCPFFHVAAVSTLLLVLASVASAQPASAVQQVYLNNCAVCHGTEGRGDGRASYLLYPKPRDFTTGVYRFKTTPENQLPTDADLQRVIGQGIERTAMPAFKDVLTEVQMQQLAAYVLSLNQNTNVPTERQAVAIPNAPEFTAELSAEGQRIYEAMGCGVCHGATGRGDGQASYTLKDSEEYPLPPADFTTGVFKAGRRSEDLYRTIVLGVPGTPMPSYVESLGQVEVPNVRPTSDRTWALVAYLRSMAAAREPEGLRAGAAINAGTAADRAMISDPLHPAWRGVEAAVLSLQPLWQRKQAVRSVNVKVVTTQEEIAVHLAWPDTTVNAPADGVDQFTDGVSVMFSLNGEIPALAMGASASGPGTAAPVNIWHWKASRQLNADTGQLHDVASSPDPAVVDLYMFKSGDSVTGPIAEHDSTLVPAWAVGNLNADPAQMKRVVLESNAAGFGSLTLQPPDQQDVSGRGVWSDGRWHVVLRRQRTASSAGDIDPSSAAKIPLAFAVWDGEAGDRNGTKLITGWHWLNPSR